jgi:glycosyltransferase involved in cell wall biosynthesis
MPRRGPDRITINGRFLTKPLVGVSRTAYELVRAIDGVVAARPDAHPPMELVAPPGSPRIRGLECITQATSRPLKGNPWEQLTLPLAHRHRPILSLANTGPMLARRGAVLLHDCAPLAMPHLFGRRFVIWYRVLLRRLGRRADLFITDSQFSRQEIETYLGVERERIVVVPLAADHFSRATADDADLPDDIAAKRPYVLAVGGWSARKNVALIQSALRLLPDLGLTLVVVGSNPTELRTSVTDAFPVVDLGAVTDDSLRWLYENAAALAYPSLYEGFGLPPIEAMTCGCPVVVSDRDVLRETCGDAALYCDPASPEELAARIRSLVSDAHLRATMIERGRARASMFTWARSAALILDALANVYGPASCRG